MLEYLSRSLSLSISAGGKFTITVKDPFSFEIPVDTTTGNDLNELLQISVILNSLFSLCFEASVWLYTSLFYNMKYS